VVPVKEIPYYLMVYANLCVPMVTKPVSVNVCFPTANPAIYWAIITDANPCALNTRYTRKVHVSAKMDCSELMEFVENVHRIAITILRN
jgi:hypothetical protein